MDIIDLLTELLKTGTLKVEIRISMECPNGQPNAHVAHCENCGWSKRGYPTQRQANKALSGHRPHCKGKPEHLDWIAELHRADGEQNGQQVGAKPGIRTP